MDRFLFSAGNQNANNRLVFNQIFDHEYDLRQRIRWKGTLDWISSLRLKEWPFYIKLIGEGRLLHIHPLRVDGLGWLNFYRI